MTGVRRLGESGTDFLEALGKQIQTGESQVRAGETAGVTVSMEWNARSWSEVIAEERPLRALPHPLPEMNHPQKWLKWGGGWARSETSGAGLEHTCPGQALPGQPWATEFSN